MPILPSDDKFRHPETTQCAKIEKKYCHDAENLLATRYNFRHSQVSTGKPSDTRSLRIFSLYMKSYREFISLELICNSKIQQAEIYSKRCTFCN